MRPSAVKRGQWCPECANQGRGAYQLLNIPTLKEIAHQRGGECLSTEYLGVHSNVLWRCAHGHEFSATPADVKNSGNWCPNCAVRWGERLCREFFEKMFNTNFPKVRPVWLKNQQGRNLELDGFNKELKIAFEHQGEHHFQEGVFTKSNTAFKRVLFHDRIKREKCAEHGVALIEVPEIGTRIRVGDLKDYIIEQAEILGVDHKIVSTSFIPDWWKVYAGGYDYLEKLRAVAHKHGGRLLTTEWKGHKVSVDFICSEGHRFTMMPYGVLYGAWCQKCAGNERGTIEDMRKIAAERGGECLSDVYVNSQTKLRWHCLKHDYTWWNTPNNIKRGQWCIACAGRTRWTIEAVKSFAESRGGVCISEKYVNTKAKLAFRCHTCGHNWETSLASLLNGSFCPRCGLQKVLRHTRKTITEMNEIAESRGGRCLSTEYLNSHTPLLFKCGDPNHPSWKAAPTNIRRGKWCPVCGRRRRGRSKPH